MPTEVDIKAEILSALTDGVRLVCETEIDKWAKTDNLDEKTVLQKFYAQWKSGKKGHQNLVNSWTAYHLGVTSKKPEEGKEFFPKRRAFARPSPPDIDSDFDYTRRHEVLDYIVDRYGRYNVGNIGTYGGLKMKSCLTRIIKSLDIANAYKVDHNGKADNNAYVRANIDKVTEIIQSLPRQRGAVMKVKDDDTGDEIVLKTLKDVVDANSRECDDFRFYMKKHPEIMKHAGHIEGLLSIFGIHASGIVISDIPLQEIAPLRTSKDSGDVVTLATQFAFEDLEALGLIKFDILAISTLTVIAESIRLIKENTGVDLDIENLPLDSRLSVESKKTFDLYKSGKLTGVFQCESTGMQDTCVQMGVDSFDDIMALISLYRPGPMDNIPDYCERKFGRQPVNYFHPTIEKHVKHILSKTYGIATYQEDLMRICSDLAGMSLGDGYVVIKGVSKKKIEIITKYKNIFVDGCVINGVPPDIANQYWEKFIVPFANYGFNAAHAACYAYNSYITAFLKANYPEEFIVAYLNVETTRRKMKRTEILENEAQRMGISIIPRDINTCGLNWEIIRKKDEANGVYKSEIRPSIHCKGLPEKAAENIVANRPYNTLKEFAEKTDSSVGVESVIALCDAKFFKMKKAKMVESFNIVREDLKSLRKKGRSSDNIFEMFGG